MALDTVLPKKSQKPNLCNVLGAEEHVDLLVFV